MIFIFAGNINQFYEFCLEADISPTCYNIKYLSSEHDLYGQNDMSIVEYGTWDKRKDCNNIVKLIESLRSAGRIR